MGDEASHSYDQVTLHVSLATAGETATVICRLQATQGQQSTEVGLWTIAAQEFGLPTHLSAEATQGFAHVFRPPTAMINGVKDWLCHIKFSGPLWLHLVKPYGYLGLAPWEEWFASVVDLPVLRLPETRTARPRETPGSLDMVICASAPMAKGPFELVEHLTRMVERIPAAVPHRRSRFHVFTDRAATEALRHIWNQNGKLNQVVWLYPPENAAAYTVPQRTGKIPTSALDAIDNPWLLWMRDALQGQSMDIVHFVCHGYCAADEAALAFAQSPLLNDDPFWSRFVGVAELKVFLVQVGAWAVAVSSPENNYSDIGLRTIADALARRGPGAVLYHDWRKDRDAAQLAAVYGFLLDPDPKVLPRTPALAVSCQPFRVAGSRAANEGDETRAPRALESLRPAPQLAALFQESGNVPSWLASSARYVEQCRWDLTGTVTESERPRASRQSEERAAGVERALAQIEHAMARIALRKKGK